MATVGCDAESARSAKEKASDAAKNAVDKTRQVSHDAIESGKTLLIRGRGWSENSLAELKAYSARLIDEHGDDINAAGAKVDALLDKIAQDPDAEVTQAAKVGRMAVLMIPFVGPTKRFADARVLFESGMETADPERLQLARRECLLAFAEAGLDISTLGMVGGRAGLLVGGIDRVVVALKLTRKINALADGDLVILDRFLDTLLSHESIRDGIDRALATDLSTLVPRED